VSPPYLPISFDAIPSMFLMFHCFT
jgi:hypothetical protein